VLYQLLSVSQAVEGERQLAGRVKSCRGAQQRDIPKQGEQVNTERAGFHRSVFKRFEKGKI
jgi:hypothetical protein